MKKGSIRTTIDLAATLDSGQVFRYGIEGNGYRVIHGSNHFYAESCGGRLFFEGISKEDAASFFRLDDDYAHICRTISNDSKVGSAVGIYNGLRLLRQEPWECTISFICTAASNIPRIKKNLDSITKAFGKKCWNGGSSGIFYKFPEIGEISDEKKLAECGLGFRAKYIKQLNDTLTKSFFNKLSKLPYNDAKEELIKLPGVGPKIADCILLFSFGHLDAFPIDTWIKKVLKEDYGAEAKSYKALSEFARGYFGKYSGYAQQFLYHWKKNLKNNGAHKNKSD